MGGIEGQEDVQSVTTMVEDWRRLLNWLAELICTVFVMFIRVYY